MQENSQNVLTVSDIRKQFQKTDDYDPKIGIEVEKVGLHYENSKPPTYGGKRGYLAILGKMYEELGWEIVKQQGKKISSMKRGKASLNLESDGRIELAGSPHSSIHDLNRELLIHQNEIAKISEVFGIIWIGCGYHPFSRNAEISDISDPRKDILVEYFSEKKAQGNDYGLAWFKKTSGIHVNLDYENEEDFARINRVMLRASPILCAIFANSPFSKKKFTGYMSFRSRVAHRNELPQFEFSKELYESEFGFDDWIEHILDLPFITLNRGDRWIMPKNLKFRDFLERGYKGYNPTFHDYDLHTKTAWKDIKCKSVIELRFLDSLPPHLVSSVAALVKGLAYDKDNLERLEKMTASWSYEDYLELWDSVSKHALEASIDGKSVLDLAKDLINMSQDGLRKYRVRNIENLDESVYLEPIKDFVFVKEKSPARWLVENWYGKWRKSFYPVIEWMQY